MVDVVEQLRSNWRTENIVKCIQRGDNGANGEMMEWMWSEKDDGRDTGYVMHSDGQACETTRYERKRARDDV